MTLMGCSDKPPGKSLPTTPLLDMNFVSAESDGERRAASAPEHPSSSRSTALAISTPRDAWTLEATISDQESSYAPSLASTCGAGNRRSVHPARRAGKRPPSGGTRRPVRPERRGGAEHPRPRAVVRRQRQRADRQHANRGRGATRATGRTRAPPGRSSGDRLYAGGRPPAVRPLPDPDARPRPPARRHLAADRPAALPPAAAPAGAAGCPGGPARLLDQSALVRQGPCRPAGRGRVRALRPVGDAHDHPLLRSLGCPAHDRVLCALPVVSGHAEPRATPARHG